MTRPIAFMGKAESGKTTAASLLMSRGLPRASFAEPIKNICNPVAEYLYGANFPKEKARWIYQAVGQAGRDEHNNFWINKLADEVKAFRCVVIDDLRYINEAEWVRSVNGIIIGIVRPGHENRLTPEQREHSSEMEQDSIVADIELVNNFDTQQEFIKSVATLYATVIQEWWINGRQIFSPSSEA
jgi:dephospho-CoA kinase